MMKTLIGITFVSLLCGMVPGEKKNVYGIFLGRTPCQEVANAWDMPKPASCFKLKWKLTLYSDSLDQPSTYSIDCILNDRQTWVGKWDIVKGTKANPKAVVIRLDPDKPGQEKHFLRGDENVLFFLDDERVLLKGNEKFSYTLNRTTRTSANH